jgi:dienelactone hydrolase
LADTLTPPEQTERFAARAHAAGRRVEVVWHRGAQHGWLTMPWDIRHFARWFDEHLQP